MDTKLLDILACPVCKGPLKLSADKTELISKGAGLAYPIRDGIPVCSKPRPAPSPPKSVWINDPGFYRRYPVALRLDPFAGQAVADDRRQADGPACLGAGL